MNEGTDRSVASSAPVDFEKCVQMYGGDRGAVLNLLDEFLLLLRKQVEVISGAFVEVNPDLVMKEAHSIKGAAAVLSAHSLVGAAFELEAIGRSGDLEEGDGALRKLRFEAEQLERYCNELRDE